MKFLELIKKIGVYCLIITSIVTCISSKVYAESSEITNFAEISEERTDDEQNELKMIYKNLFPNEYHYIDEYEKYGAQEISSSEVKVIVYETASYEGIDYELIVMNNGQIFLNYWETEEFHSVGSGRAAAYGTFYSKDFTIGALDHYTTFTIDYLINQTDYDNIIACRNIQGDGFYLYPTNLSKKMTEDAEGPAHYGYNNVSMNFDGSGNLFDIGVGVGNNKAKGIIQLSTGADMWLWSFIYAFFFGD